MASYNHLETSNDKGERKWDDDVIRDLNETYPDWRKPLKTYMVPCDFSSGKPKLDEGFQAEKFFGDLLQRFGESRQEGMFALYSYDFAEKISYWRKESNKFVKVWEIGDHDFVILHPKCGIIFFQVNRKHC